MAAAYVALAQVGLDARALLPATGLTTLDLLMELARCLATEPQLVLLDEPFAGLGGDGIAVMMQLVRRLRQDGITVVIIEHHASAGAVDRSLGRPGSWRESGRGPPAVVTRHPQVIEAYLGKRWLTREQS